MAVWLCPVSIVQKRLLCSVEVCCSVAIGCVGGSQSQGSTRSTNDAFFLPRTGVCSVNKKGESDGKRLD